VAAEIAGADPAPRLARTPAVSKISPSPEDVFANLSVDATRLSGEVLAANVLAATVISCLGVDTAIAEQARALLAQITLRGGDTAENARLMAEAETRLEALLNALASRHLRH
jgi:hypothetical protein